MKSFIFRALTAALMSAVTLIGALAQANITPCPGRIETKQNAVHLEKGWTVFNDPNNASPILRSVDFYDGNPKGMANLAPDDTNNEKNPTWSFAPRTGQKKTDIWLVCRYRNTNISLTKQLPPEIKKCAVHYNRDISPNVQGIDCN